MAESYTTQEADTVDLIAWNRYGRTKGVTEAILRANPGLAKLGPVLDAGVKMTLPDVAAEAVTKTVVRIWGNAS